MLVIDDDSATTELLRLFLEQELYEVITTKSGQEGIAAARQSDPDIVILDLVMPDLDGWGICKAIRSFSQAPIIMLSVINMPGMSARALDAGADEFLTKPIHKGVLMAHLKRLTRRARAEKEASAAKGDG